MRNVSIFSFSLVYLSVVSLATFVASFGVDIWNPRNVGSHSTEKSRDQCVKRKVVFARVGMCMDINYKIDKRLMSRLVVKLRDRRDLCNTAHSSPIMVKKQKIMKNN